MPGDWREYGIAPDERQPRAAWSGEIIRPALANGRDYLVKTVFTIVRIAYQGYGRQLDLKMVQRVVDVAVGETKPDLTLLLTVPPETGEKRLAARQATLSFIQTVLKRSQPGVFSVRWRAV